MTDADLNALFAEKVAGWVPYIAPKNKGSLLLPYTHFDGSGVPQVGIAPFTASMDAVLPYMNKTFAVWSYHTDRPPGHLCADMIPRDSRMIEAYGPLPRACVLALLRAQGVGVISRRWLIWRGEVGGIAHGPPMDSFGSGFRRECHAIAGVRT